MLYSNLKMEVMFLLSVSNHLQDFTASQLQLPFYSELGGSTSLQNTGYHLQCHTYEDCHQPIKFHTDDNINLITPTVCCYHIIIIIIMSDTYCPGAGKRSINCDLIRKLGIVYDNITQNGSYILYWD